MRIGFRKILRDVWRSKGRTFLAVLSIFIGVFAIGVVSGMNDLLLARMIDSYRATHPAHVRITLSGSVSNDDVARLARLPGVAEIQGLRTLGARWQLNPETAPRNVSIVVRDSYTQQKLNTLKLLSGDWPGKDSIAVEHASAEVLHAAVGGSITLLIDKREREFKVSGLIEDLAANPIGFGGDPQIYISPQLAEDVFNARGYNRLRLQIPVYSEAAAQDTLIVLKAQLEKMGAPVFSFSLQAPDEHPMQDTVNGVTLIIGVMAVLALALGLFLIINTVNAVVAQQVPQIGVMKAIGGSTRQMLSLYLSGVLIYGLLALLLAVPLGILAASGISTMLLQLMLVPPAPGLQISTPAIIQQVLIGLGAPLLAALWPIYTGVCVTVREAISSYGIDTGFGRGRLDRLLSRLRFLPRTVSLTIRNTFRRKGRVALTQITLIMAGVVFSMVLSSAASFTYTINTVTDSTGLKVLIVFQRPVRIDEVTSIVQAQPNVGRFEVQLVQASTAFKSQTADQGEDIFISAVQPAETLMHLPLISGRWLLPDDGHAVVLNRNAADQLGATVGDKLWFSLQSGESKTEWTVVGTVFDFSNRQLSVYVPLETYQHDVGLVGRTTSVRVSTIPDNGATQVQVEQQLRDIFNAQGLPVSGTQTADLIRTRNENNFGIITTLLVVMSSLIAAVGAIGLAGTLSINVLERRREIGVMRAIGASSITIAGILIGEGLLLGLMAWLIALPLSIPVGQVFSVVIGQVINFNIAYQFSWNGTVIWLIIVLVLSVLGSLVPALRAARISVRESLAYE